MAGVTFLLSAFQKDQWPELGPAEIAFAGRSNVGKSSCLNTLIQARGAAGARVSRTPGRTQSLNFFDVRDDGRDFRFVDLPGYGFAKVPDSVKRGWDRLVGSYLKDREAIALVVVLVDLRHDPTDLDRNMIGWLDEFGRKGLLLCTKADQIPKSRRLDRQAKICRALDVPLEASLLFSSTDDIGRDSLWTRIREASRDSS